MPWYCVVIVAAAGVPLLFLAWVTMWAAVFRVRRMGRGIKIDKTPPEPATLSAALEEDLARKR